MSIYIEKKIETIASQGILSVAWSAGVIKGSGDCIDSPILAISNDDGEVVLSNMQGRAIQTSARISGGEAECVCMVWHAEYPILAMGWEDGRINYWSGETISIHEVGRHNDSPISALKWSKCGKHLASCDNGGTIFLWSKENGSSKFTRSQSFERVASKLSCIELIESRSSASPRILFNAAQSNDLMYSDNKSMLTKCASYAAAPVLVAAFAEWNVLVVITGDSFMYKYSMIEYKLEQKMSVKISVKGDCSSASFVIDAKSGLIMGSNRECVVRTWDIINDQARTLSLEDPRHMAKANDVVVSIDYNRVSHTLLGCTEQGRFVMWKALKTNDTSTIEWLVLPPVNPGFDHSPYRVHCAPWPGLFAVSFPHNALLLAESELKYMRVARISILQVNAEKIIAILPNRKIRKLSANLPILGICSNDRYIVLWSGHKIEVHEIEETIKFIAAFDSEAVVCAIHRDTLFLALFDRVESCNIQGIVKKVLSFEQSEGHPIHLHVGGDSLVAVSSKNVLKMWDLSRREPRSVVPGRGLGEGSGKLFSVSINKTGSHISFLCHKQGDMKDGIPLTDPRIQVYDVELDKIYDYLITDGVPTRQCWDDAEPKLLIVSTKPSSFESGESVTGTTLSSFFVTTDHGIVYHDSLKIQHDILLGSEIPFVYLVEGDENGGGNASGGGIPHITTRIMRNFEGLGDVDEQAKQNLTEFSFQMAIGNTDEAFRAVKSIRSASIWKNLAKLCVKSRRLDVARICLGHMGSARGAQALRLSSNAGDEPEAQIATIAIDIGMYQEAEDLYAQCKRYDLLLQFLMASNNWTEAVKIAEQHCRISLKTFRFQYASYLEGIGDLESAIHQYEMAERHIDEVPRMLVSAQKIPRLKQYVESKNEARLHRWWAQYMECAGLLDDAYQYYESARDAVGQVRVLCYKGEIDRAKELCINTLSPAACNHLARFLETAGNVNDAINFFLVARRYKQAIRVARSSNLDERLLAISLESPPGEQIEAAIYFEEQGDFQKAVLLYQRAGNTDRALQLCFRAQLFDSLRNIAEELGSDTNPALLTRCADFFMHHQQYEKAARLSLLAGRLEHAVNLYIEHKIPINEDIAEKLTPPKPEHADPHAAAAKSFRTSQLLLIATALRDQGSFHLATKKFTQAGDRINAMKCLLKSNDTTKIVYYANMTKSPEIFILAANHLQNMNWHDEPEISKAIITFYTKANAYESLAYFFDSCASVEMDDYRDYEKALKALKDTVRLLKIDPNLKNRDEKVENAQSRMQIVERFISAKNYGSTDPSVMVNELNALLKTPHLETFMRVGDIFGVLIEYFFSQKDMENAYSYLKQMENQRIPKESYLSATTVSAVLAYMGIDHKSNDITENDYDDDVDEDIDDDD